MLTGGRGGCKRQNFPLTPSGVAALAGGSVLWKWPLGAELCHNNKTVNDKTSLRMTKWTGRAALPYFLHKVCFSRQIQFMILSSFRWQTARSDPCPCLTSGQRVSAVSVLSFRFSFSRRPSSALTHPSQPKNPLEKFYFCLLWLAFCFFVTHSLLRIHAKQLYAPFFFSSCFFTMRVSDPHLLFKSGERLQFVFYILAVLELADTARRTEVPLHGCWRGCEQIVSSPRSDGAARFDWQPTPTNTTPLHPLRFPWLISVASSSNAEACLKKNKNF